MSKKPGDTDSKKLRSSGTLSSSDLAASKSKSKKPAAEDDSDKDDGSDEEETKHAPESDDDDDSNTLKKSKAAADSAEKSDLAAYLNTPSLYISANPHLPLSKEEQNERLEVEELLSKLKGHQKDLMERRGKNQKDLEGMRGNLKKIRKETDELMKSQQTNLSTMGRKLH